MNYNHQRKLIKPTAKCCYWCRNFKPCMLQEVEYEGTKWIVGALKPIRLTHRQHLKTLREEDFRYCKAYRYSKHRFKEYKKMCEENSRLTNFL